ncbi:hypothetical protein DUNSADRAFT_8156 [Dunaliella salina]|uniref:Malic enzyme n=1 Tax=Dunaliella salina TaxID=3046 RepID=A0ABQ7GJY7_DUNSA|nr:hypothetical protein DUNSADRAFT_8156 [Dunaliella salina]|eukprot:KAF5834929.1 hypothetical protein DUNSADRAFT_8156 [Dunaliella salina]
MAALNTIEGKITLYTIAGMGISEGKITLYTIAAGVDPSVCLPVCLDMGTNNKRLLEDPQYQGLKRERATGAEFDSLIAEFMDALSQWQPHGTAAITLAAILAALRAIDYEKGNSGVDEAGKQMDSDEALGQLLAGKQVLFLGAGEAGTGIGELIAYCVHRRTGCSMQEARKTCHFVDSKGLVCASRMADLQHHKQAFAPHTEGRVLFASGSPFDPISAPSQPAGNASQLTPTGDSILVRPAQANNAYVFPALGHAAVLTRCSSISDEAFLVSAEALAAMADPKMVLREGALFPPFSKIKDTSCYVMAHVMACMVREGRGLCPEGVPVQQGHGGAKASDFLPYCLAQMWLGPGEKAPETAIEPSHRSSRL